MVKKVTSLKIVKETNYIPSITPKMLLLGCRKGNNFFS